MKNLKSHFKFTKQERSGIFFLLLLLIGVQLGYYLYDSTTSTGAAPMVPDVETQARIDALKLASATKDTLTLFPFNPNFITDFKGYTLGMSLDEIDRLHRYREKSNFVNSAAEFQEITLVSDSLLAQIAPYFKFPEWTRKETFVKTVTSNSTHQNRLGSADVKDLNTATAVDLQRVHGIGEKLSARIIKFRDRLGGFLVDEQLYEVYGLEPEVASRALLVFKVITIPEIVKINVNTATAQELSKLIYLQKDVVYAIINYRNLNGGIDSLNELENVEGFPIDRIDRIKLYLSL